MRKIFLFMLFGIFILSSLSFVNMVSAESGMVVFQNSTAAFVRTPQYMTWNETAFSPNLNITEVTGKLQWNVLKNNPLRKEMVLGTLDNKSHVDIYLYNSTGNWTQSYPMTPISGVNATRAYDVAVEQNSGDVLVAYNNGSVGIVSYQIWNGTDWYKSGNLTTNLTGRVNWIKMASDRYSTNNNDIMLIAADNNSRLTAMNWNGTNWTIPYLLETVLENVSKECFDVVYENSGDALIVWANASRNTVRYVTYSNKSWGVTANAPASSGQTADFQWLRLANYPNTDRIMLCSVDAGADLNCVEWTGSGWGSVTEIDAAIEYVNVVSFRNFDIIPDTSSNSFFLMYGDADADYYSTKRCFGTANCQAGVWETTQTFLSGVDIGTDTSWASLYYDPENVGKITAVMADQTATPATSSNCFIAIISCTNSANSCATNQTSKFLSVSSSAWYESAMFAYQGRKPTIQNITTSSSTPPSTLMTIAANNINDTNNNTLNFYCSISSSLPTSSNTICTGGNTIINPPYAETNCSYTSQSTDGTYVVYCRVYDGDLYSTTVNASYVVSSSVPTTSVVSVAGDTIASYFDTLGGDGITSIIISGESEMTCKWASSDLAYSGMSNPCITNGILATCNITGISSEGFYTRYVSCANSIGNGQSSLQNLDIDFYLDYSAPTTSDNSNTGVHAQNYVVNITEGDAVDSDPKTYYCTSSSEGCNPITSIDNGGQITYTSSNRGANYLRYYSVDFAGNSQVVVNKTININQLPVFTSASDDAVTIKGSAAVNVSTVYNDSDSGQEISLFVCNSTGATSLGCAGTQYCNATATANASCNFTSESDSALHTWYAYIFDELGEAATANPLTGSYTTDSQNPTITLTNPLNNSNITQNSTTFTIVVNEALTNAWYSLDSGVENVSMSNVSLYLYTHSNTSIAEGTYNLTIWANDSYGNIGRLSGNSFTIDTSIPDRTPPVITIWSPVNESYYASANVLFNITGDEALNWTGFTNNSGSLINLGNVSATNWNATITFAEGQHNITVYANDSSANRNQANKSVIIYVDLTDPSVDAFSCTNPVNDSGDVNCSANVSDAIGLNYAIIGHNATGTLQNSSRIYLTGTSARLSYIISAGNTTPGNFSAKIYLYDLSGRNNLTTSYLVNISDDTFPTIWNVTYQPNTTVELDPDVRINVNATIVENYKISKVELMWQNLSDGNWISVIMTNNSDIANGSSATVVYNASFLPKNGTYVFRINATDLAGNSNVSSNITINIANESTFWNGTTIPTTKSFTSSQRSENNTLGIIYLNNTGDNSLNFNLSISASALIQSRFNINYTNDDNATYPLNLRENVSLSIFVNTTGLSIGLNPYNITISSEAGTIVYERQLNIQTSAGAYLQILIEDYSSSVITSQTGITYAVSVTNAGTQDASNVDLTWTLPSIFTLASGNLTRSFSNLPIGSSGTNTITVNVDSSTSDATYYIDATATSSNADSVNTSKAITVSNPVIIIQTVTVPGPSGGGGGGGAGAGGILYSKIVEIVRGEENSFDIEINNKYPNSSLEDLILNLTGFLPQYISISPSKISNLNYGETGKFKVTIKAPAYKGYEEYILKAIISGYKVNRLTTADYSETQNIKLIIQEVSQEKSNLVLSEAEKAILEMQNAGFNIQEASRLLEQAKLKLSENKNKEAFDLSENIISMRDKAFSVNDLIEKISEVLKNPRKTNLLTGNIAKEIIDENGEKVSINAVLSGKTIFSGESAETVLNMAIAAFNRGDFNTAEERAKSAQVLLLLERKGNFGLFLYLYWYFVLIGFVIFSFAGILSYQFYQKSSITKRIGNIDKEEDNIINLFPSSQKNYLLGKISSGEYHKTMSQHQDKLAKIKQERLSLRNKRIKMLKPQQILQDLGIEKMRVESEIKKLQEKFYRDRKISENEYKTEFKILNERLVEIEGERITLELLKEKKGREIKSKDVKEEIGESTTKSRKENNKPGRIKIILLKIAGFLKSPFKQVNEIRKNDKKGIILIDKKVMDIIKREGGKRGKK